MGKCLEMEIWEKKGFKMSRKFLSILAGVAVLGLTGFVSSQASAVIVVAVAQDTSVGGASWAPDFGTAEEQAMQACGQSDCMILNQQYDGCIAVARANGVAYAGAGPDIASAQETVLNYSGNAPLWFYACADGSNNLGD